MIRNTLLLFVTAVAISGCLDKLEDLTAQTKDEVAASRAGISESNKLISETRDDQHVGAYLGLIQTSPDASLRQGAAVELMYAADLDKSFFYFGAPRPLQNWTIDGNSTALNVVQVGPDSDPLTLAGGISPQRWDDFATACGYALSGLLKDATDSNTPPDVKATIADRGEKVFYTCAAVAGARAQHQEDPVQAAKNWPRDQTKLDQINRVKDKISDLMRQLVSQDAFKNDGTPAGAHRADLVPAVENLIEIKIQNNLTRAIDLKSRGVLKDGDMRQRW